MNTGAPCILVAEDEMLVAMMLEDMLQRKGCRVLLVARLRRGLELAANGAIDGAILDINLAGEESYPIAAALRSRKLPFVFASGYGRGGVPEDYRDVDVLSKPYGAKQVEDAVARMLAGRPHGKAGADTD